jgi:hypothetical protein
MITTLILGDWSQDGHSLTEEFQIDHNLASSDDLQKAYQTGTDLLDINFQDEVASRFEDHFISEELLEMFVENKILNALPNGQWVVANSPMNHDPIEAVEVDQVFKETKYTIGTEAYLALWMAIAQWGDPSLVWSKVPIRRIDQLTIGGYGLFEM